MRRAVLALAAVLVLPACGKTMSDDDCKKVGQNMRQVWDAEARKSIPQNGVVADKAAAVIRSEGDKLVSDWSTECKKELEGRRVDAKEVDCLLEAKTVAEIHRCADL